MIKKSNSFYISQSTHLLAYTNTRNYTHAITCVWLHILLTPPLTLLHTPPEGDPPPLR